MTYSPLKTIPLLAMLLGASGASGGVLSFTDDYRLELEGGVALPRNMSGMPLVVQNNSGAGGPYPVVPLVGTDALDYGTPASIGARLSRGLENGGRAYVRLDAVQGSGTRDLSALFFIDGAIPGTFDDGKRLSNNWDPQATVTTATQAYSLGYLDDSANGLRWSIGIMHAQAAQDLQFSYDVSNTGQPDHYVYGLSQNSMNGIDLGLAWRQDASARLSVETEARLAGLANSYSYTYKYVNLGGGQGQQPPVAGGNTTVLRAELSVKLSYALRDNLHLTGRVGVVNYDGVATGIDNLLNPLNTADVVNPVSSGSIRLPYVRLGVEYRF